MRALLVLAVTLALLSVPAALADPLGGCRPLCAPLADALEDPTDPQLPDCRPFCDALPPLD